MSNPRDMSGKELVGALADAFQGKRPDDDISVLMEAAARIYELEAVRRHLDDALSELRGIQRRSIYDALKKEKP